MNSQEIVKALKKGVITVVFEKIDTKEIRTMPCTLNQDIHGQSLEFKNYASPDTLVMWGLDLIGWRVVRLISIVVWYE